jgi:hypothetical protein
MKSTQPKAHRWTYRPLLELLETRLAPANVDVLSYHNDPFLTGANLQEELLTPANVNATSFGRLFTDRVDGYVYAQPLYKANLAIPGQGTHNVAFIATEHDSVYALDTDNPAAGPGPDGSLWKTSFTNPANGVTSVPAKEVGLVSTNIVPEVGITGTPVIDGTTNTLYVVAKTKEVRADGTHYVQRLHALDLATGQEKFGGPALIGDTTATNVSTSPIVVPGNGDGSVNAMVTFNARTQLNRVALQLVNGIVYIAWASHEDARPYHGWVAGFRANNLAAGPVRFFNTAPNAGGVGIWQSGGALSADPQGNLYFAVGNGFNGPNLAYDPSHGDYSESVVKLSATGQLSVVDYFTPYDWQTLDNQDADLGSGGAMLLPDFVGSTAHPHLMVETGKSGVIYLLDRDNLGKNSPDLATEQTKIVQRVVAGQAGVWGNPSFFKVNATSGIIYYHGQGDVLKGYVISNGHIDDTSGHILRSGFGSGYPGEQPVVSANGIANPTSPTNGIVWELQVDQYGNEGRPNSSAILRAFNAGNLSTELYDSNQTSLRDQNGSAVKFTVPTVTNGHVLVGAQYSFTVFGLFPPATAVPAARTNLQGTGQATSQGPQIMLTWTNPTPTTGTAPTGIKILRSTDGTNFSLLAIVGGRDSSYTDLGPLTFGQHYFYRVVATNQQGDAAPSNTVEVIAPIRSAVLTISSITSRSLGLSWTSVANDHYDIERSTDGANYSRVATVPAAQTTYTDSGLMPGIYAYRIRAFNTNPTASSLSNVQGADVGDTINHGADFSNTTDLTANGDTQFQESTARLTAADLQTGSVFTSNRITIAKFTTTFLVRLHEGTQPNYADGFAFVIQALAPTALGQGLGGLGYQGIGNSVAIKFGTFQYAGDPSSSATGLVLNGAAPRGGVDTNPNGMGVLLNSQDTKQIDLSYDGTTLTEKITDTMRNTTFMTSFTVNIPQVIGSDLAYIGFTASTGSPGAASAWEIQDVKTWQFKSQAPLPGTPGNLRVASTGATEVDLAWGGNSYNETGFRIERSTDGLNFTTAGMSTTTTFADTGLTHGTYFYRVRAVNTNGASDVSNTVEATVPVSDPAPVITSITRSSFNVVSGGTLTLTVNFTDADASDPHTAVIAWGDGSTNTTMSLAAGVVRFNVSHTYTGATLGNYSLRVAVQDDDGGSSTVNLTASTTSVTPPDGLIDWWTGDGLNTTTAPDIAGTNPGTLVGGVTYAAGKVGNAFRFNGIDGYVKLPNNSIPFPTSGQQNGALSFTAWFQTLSGGVIIGQQGGPAFGGQPAGWVPGVYVGTDGKLWAQMFWNGSVQQVSSPNAVNDGQFHFVAISSNGTTESVYLDNRLIGTTSGLQVAYNTNYFYQLGTGYTAGDWKSVPGGWYAFQGLLDEVQVYNTALTPAAIQAIYNAGSAGQVKGVTIVNSPAPVITGISRSPNVVAENGTLTLSGTFTDAQMGNTHTVTITWGDGSANSTVSLAAGVFNFTANHQYTEEPASGSGYALRVLVQSSTGGTDTLDLTAAAAAVAPPAGLVSWWTGDGANTIAPDIAGPNPGTLNGGVTYVAGKVGNAFRFDGSATSYVNVPDAPSLNTTTGATWDFWVKTTQSGSYVGFMGKHDAAVSYNGVTVWLDPSGVAAVQIKGNPATTTLLGTTHINDGQFHHLALTFVPGGAAVLYVDGQRQAADTAPVFAFNANPLRLGKMLDNFWAPLNGMLDEVQVFNRVLTAAEVQAIYQAGSSGQVKGAVVVDPAVTANGGYQVSVVAGAASRMQTVATFTDPAGSEALSDYSAMIDWGDHTTSPGMISGPNNGVFTVQGSHVYAQAGSFPITVTIHHDKALDATANSTAQVSAAVIHFLVAGFPSPSVAGSPGSFTVTALDQFNETLVGYRGTVRFSSSDGQAMLPGNYAFTAADQGVHAFSGAILKTAGSQSITVTDTADSAFTGAQFGILVTPGPTRTLVVTDFPSPTTAGTPGGVLVTALDAYGNVTPGYTGTMHLTSSDGQAILQPDHTFTAADGGRYAFAATLFTAGTQSITATDTANSSITGSQSGIVVNPAAAATVVASPFPSPTTAGDGADITVMLLDPYGNVVTGYRGTVHFSSSDPQAALPDDYMFTAVDAGVHTFSVTLFTAGLQTLSISDVSNPNIASEQDGIEVDPDVAHTTLVVAGFPSPIAAGTPGTFTVAAEDPYGNIITDYADTVAFFSSDDQAQLPDNYTFTPDDQGSHTFMATLFTVGTQILGAVDVNNSHIAGEQTDIEVDPPAGNSFQLSGFPSPIQGVHSFQVAFYRKGGLRLALTDAAYSSIAGVQTDIQVVGGRGQDGQDIARTGDGGRHEFGQPFAQATRPDSAWVPVFRSTDATGPATETEQTGESVDADRVQQFFAFHPVDDLGLAFEDISELFGVEFPR